MCDDVSTVWNTTSSETFGTCEVCTRELTNGLYQLTVAFESKTTRMRYEMWRLRPDHGNLELKPSEVHDTRSRKRNPKGGNGGGWKELKKSWSLIFIIHTELQIIKFVV